MRAEQLAGHLGQRDGFARRAASGGVGQQARAALLDQAVEVAGGAGLRELPLEPHGDHLRAGRRDGLLQNLRRGIAGRAEKEAAFEQGAADLEGHVSLR